MVLTQCSSAEAEAPGTLYPAQPHDSTYAARGDWYNECYGQ
jgi:hypothetical protein